MRTRKWQDQNGQDRYTTEIQGDVMQMLGTRPQSADGANNPQPMPQQDASANALMIQYHSELNIIKVNRDEKK